MKIKIKYEHIVILMLIIVSFGGLLISTFKLTNSIYYVADALNILLFILAIKKIINSKLKLNKNDKTRNIFILFVIVTLIGIILNFKSIYLTLWGIRNVYRYFLFYFSCIILLSRDDAENILQVILKMYWINFALSIFQSIFYKIGNDNLGGIFGTMKGCNGATTIFINIVIIYIISQYLNKKISLKKLLMYVLTYFIITVLAEIKGNFIFFIVTIILALMVSKRNKRMILFGSTSILLIIIGYNMLIEYFPDNANTLLDLDSANKYMDATYLNRVTFTRNALFSVTNKYFFKDNAKLYIIGYGIGNCDTSKYITSDFYMQYGDMNYRQYGTAMLVLQNGYIGYILYCLWFIAIALNSLKNTSLYDEKYKYIRIMTVCIAFFCIIDNFYASLFVEGAYFIFFMLSIPTILLENKKT